MNELNFRWAEALFILLAAMAFIQLIYYWLVYQRLAFARNRTAGTDSHPVSVVICAKNEATRLQKYLPAILEQAYHNFEVVVVNDCSWDETAEYLEQAAKQYSRLKVVTIKEQEKYRHGKKFALTIGVKAAVNDILLFTDADCLPAGKNWISQMQQHYTNEKEIVLGYGAYQKEAGMLNRLIRFDTFSIAMQYLSSALGKNAYMGTGRNLSYRKSLFFRNKGFAGHNHILSGDDDLFVNETANTKNVAVELSPESFTYSEPEKTFNSWMKQKSRHFSTSRYYKPRHKLMLFTSFFSNMLFYILLITLLILRFDWRILLSLYAGLLLIKSPIIYQCASRLKERDLVWSYPVLDFIHTFLQPVFYISNLFSKQKTWK
jgi:poly-beta-1,6-N-acetyl-D-glucosamine synthase